MKKTAIIISSFLSLCGVGVLGISLTKSVDNIETNAKPKPDPATPAEPQTQHTYNILTNVSELEEGTQVIIASRTDKTLMGKNKTSGYLSYSTNAKFSPSTKTVTLTEYQEESVAVLTVEKDTTNNYKFVSNNDILSDTSFTIELESNDKPGAKISPKEDSAKSLRFVKNSGFVITNTTLNNSKTTIYYTKAPMSFLNKFYKVVTCDKTGQTAPTTSEMWNTLATEFNALNTQNKEELINATYTVSGSGENTVVTPTGTTSQRVAQAMYDYDYIVAKYDFSNFIGRSQIEIRSFLSSRNDTDGSILAGSTLILTGLVTSCLGIFYTKHKKEN